MSKMEIYSCDGCGKIAPDDFNICFLAEGWMQVKFERVQYQEVCSADCLAIVAVKLGGRIITEADQEVTTPAVAPKRKPKPRTS